MLLIEFGLNFRRCEDTAARVSYRKFMAWPSSVRGARRALQMNWMTYTPFGTSPWRLSTVGTSLVELLSKLRV